MTLIDLISLSLLFRTGAKGKGTWDFKLQLPVAGSFVSEFRLGPPPGMKAYDVQGGVRMQTTRMRLTTT